MIDWWDKFLMHHAGSKVCSVHRELILSAGWTRYCVEIDIARTEILHRPSRRPWVRRRARFLFSRRAVSFSYYYLLLSVFAAATCITWLGGNGRACVGGEGGSTVTNMTGNEKDKYAMRETDTTADSGGGTTMAPLTIVVYYYDSYK